MKYIFSFSLLFLSTVLFAQNDIFNAIQHGDSNPVQDILRYDATAANSINSIGHSPLMVASHDGKKEIVSLLLASGANVNFDTDNGTALMEAASQNHAEVVEILLTNNADVNEPDAKGKTPLILAINQNNSDIVSLLLNFGADQHQKDEFGKSARDYAEENQNDGILVLMKNFE